MNAFKNLVGILNISLADMAPAVQCSRPMLSQVVNHQRWPKKNASELRSRIVDFLKNHTTQNGADIPPSLLQQLEAAPAQPPKVTQEKDDIMLLRNANLTQAAKQHFGITRSPFADEIHTTEDVFASSDIKYVREGMLQTALHGGFIAVVGESGAGKTTLREDLIDRINRENRAVVVIEPYVLAMEDNDIKGKTLKASHIAEAILESVAPGTNPKRSPEARFRQVHKALQDSARAGNKHVLIIEEAHGMPLPTLKHLKRFFELKNGFQRLLGIVLIGQTELAQKLSENNPHVREVVQRCELLTLQPLDDGRLTQYLKFKFARVGKNVSDVLDNTAIEAIAERLTLRTRAKAGIESHSLLYPLAVNNLVSAAMNEAATLLQERVTGDTVRGV